eukprot:scaffold49611_cov66-Phaeocystis_antarctica.AAC.1
MLASWPAPPARQWRARPRDWSNELVVGRPWPVAKWGRPRRAGRGRAWEGRTLIVESLVCQAQRVERGFRGMESARGRETLARPTKG